MTQRYGVYVKRHMAGPRSERVEDNDGSPLVFDSREAAADHLIAMGCIPIGRADYVERQRLTYSEYARPTYRIRALPVRTA